MHDAGLNHGLGKDGRDRLGESFETVDDGDQDVVDAAQLQLVHHLEPEFGAFGLLDPKPKNVFVARRIEPERDVDRLVFDHAFVAYFDPERVKKYHWVNRIEGTALPFPDFLKDRVRNLADEVGRDIGAIELGQVALD